MISVKSMLSLLVVLVVSAVPAFAADSGLEWIKSPHAYFLTPEERAEWKRSVVSPADADRFIAEFWRKRGEQFRKDVNTRIEFAHEHFELGKIPGSRTQRGRVFIVLGSPNEQQSRRGAGVGGAGDASSSLPGNLRQSALTSTRWTYRKDRLPQELATPELTVIFQTDEFRAHETIENPGLVEPFLTKMAVYLSERAAVAEQARLDRLNATGGISGTAPMPGSTLAAMPPDPLWNSTPEEKNVIYTGEAYVSPTGSPFYAISAFVPQSATAFGQWKSALLVSLVRDASGAQVLADRQQVDLRSYDDRGNRHVDRSFALPPGKYEGHFALVTPEGTTTLSSHRRWFEVPAADASRASQLMLTSRIETLESQQPFDPFTFVATRYAVRGDRKFKAADKIGFFTVVANPADLSSPKLMQKMTITRDGKPFFSSPLESAQVTQTGPKTFLVGVSFDPNTFQPGLYTLQLQVRDFAAPSGSEARSKGYVLSTDFQVIP